MRAVAASPRAAEALRALERASKGLLVISECDEPFLPFAWPEIEAGPFSPAALAARYGGDGGGGGCGEGRGAAAEDEDDDEDDDDDGSDADATPPFTVEPAAAWLERAARAAEAARRPDEAERFRALGRLMAALLRGPAVAVRVGGGVGRLGVFLVGAVRRGDDDGAEEEGGSDLGVFPVGAQVVGLETAQVET